METYNYLIENGFAIQDNICVFCSTITDRWNRFCPKCNDYKGLMPITDAVDTYGRDILPV